MAFRAVGRLLLLTGLLVGMSGCAYYNTFYLARKYYTQGEVEQRKDTTGRLSPAAADRWDKSIKQAQKVLQRYPNSKWTDDALFLIGKAYFGREEYGSSRQYFQQLLDSYPNSEYALEARFWTARTWAAETDYARASDAFKEILAAGPPASWADQVLYAQGEVEFAREDYTGATGYYRQLAERYPNGTRAFDALTRIGDAAFQRRQWAEAQKAYTGAMARARGTKERLDLRLKIGQCMEKIEKFDEALDLYRQTSIELVGVNRYNQITADPMAGISNREQLESELAKQGSDNPDDPNYSQNHYNSNNAGNNGTNGNYDPNAAGNANFGSAAVLAQYQQAGDLNRRAAAEAIQQDPLAAQLPRILLRQGLCLSARGDQKGAISTFRAIVTAYRGTAEASEAQYRIGYINEVELQDYTAARKAYDDVKTQGQSLFGEQATKRSGNLARLIALAAADTVKGAKATKKSLEAEAERAFLAAELFMFQQEKPDKALEQYAIVEADFPKSSFAPRAALARAWILTNAMGDTAGGAQIYRDIADKYQGSDAWRMAYQLVHGEPPKEAPRVAPPPDSTLAAAPGDSAAADSTGAAPGAPALTMTPAPDLPVTPLPTLTSKDAAADSAAPAASPQITGVPPMVAAQVGGVGSPATPVIAPPVVPGGAPPQVAVLTPSADSLLARRDPAPVPLDLNPVDPGPVDPKPVDPKPADPQLADPKLVDPKLADPQAGDPTPAAVTPVAPPAATPAATPAPAPPDPPADAITPGTPHRMTSRVLKEGSAGGEPRAWADWQRWLKSPASRRVIPGPVGRRPPLTGGGAPVPPGAPAAGAPTPGAPTTGAPAGSGVAPAGSKTGAAPTAPVAPKKPPAGANGSATGKSGGGR